MNESFNKKFRKEHSIRHLLNTLGLGNEPLINFPASLRNFQPFLNSACDPNDGVSELRRKLFEDFDSRFG